MAASLRRDAVLLGLVQLSQQLLPLLVLPWLTTRLGPAGFGRTSIAIAVAGYFVVLADYGFNLSATRAIAVARDDKAARSAIFWSTMAVKAGLGALGLAALALLATVVPALAQQAPLLAAASLFVVGSVLTPVWYFQGIERLPELAGWSLLVGVLSLPATVWLVQSPADAALAVAIPGLASCTVGLACLVRLQTLRHLTPPRVTLAGARASLADGWWLFASSAGVTLYTHTNTVVVGLVAGPAQAGWFAAADRLVRAVHGLLTPIARVAYPRIAHRMQSDPDGAFALLRRLLRLQVALAVGVGGVLFAVAPWLVDAVFGAAYAATADVLRWMAPLPLLVALSNVFGVQTMLPLDMKRAFAAILLGAGIVNVSLLVPLASWFGAPGAAVALVVCEGMVTAAMFAVLRRRRVPLVMGRRARAAPSPPG